ncbi:methyltransferase domain-containing protein [Azospirillum sp. RWY-5-1]|uniref:Methyltransferase domain-containing protein n=1 Tax=Azospirillum oleiclasticum TaxID=2735135 RepID=A0ABX2TK48_9PROT|nr:class I SAM-dependent methyltransferase [Azospirillum oleiclasticum]NYZ15979.1 methyltransferase domain-containing protein [Azospirillum oleiclasticum]NYZ23542.1 methyltransferase domain-containing protein [Azospirillum oleiclasticum]
MTLAADSPDAPAPAGGRHCPACGAPGAEPVYRLSGIPTNSCMLVDTRDAALAFPTAALELCLCGACGFLFNAAWRPGRTVYAAGYEETQGYSPTFTAFHRALAAELTERFALRGARVLEIGCGKGEFLALLVGAGAAEGLGYDPGYVPGRLDADTARRVRVIPEYFDENTPADPGALVCCKMTLEHVYDVAGFVRAVRRLIGDRDTGVFFMVPDAGRILDDVAFWDVYYEHVSYFTADSLAGLFRREGFAVEDVWTGYGGQYLMIAARPGRTAPEPMAPGGVAALRHRALSFSRGVDALRRDWRERLAASQRQRRRVALWGSGSKAVSFVTTVGIGDEVACVADINPHRHGCFLPGSGHRIVSPAEVAALAPDLVVVMNPLYRAEVARDLETLGCRPEIVTL